MEDIRWAWVRIPAVGIDGTPYQKDVLVLQKLDFSGRWIEVPEVDARPANPLRSE